MRVVALLGLSCLITLTSFAETPKDTPSATATRKRLKTKITVEFNQTMLKEIMSELSSKLEDAKAGSIRAFPDPGKGVSMNQRLSYSAKDKSVEEILDEMFKEPGLGYVVVAKDGDRYDGWLKITKGTERGYEASATDGKDKDSKKKEELTSKKKEEMKKKEETKKSDDAANEKAATMKLETAKAFLDIKKPEKAKPILEDLIKKYPMTKAAEEATQLLEKLDK